MITIGSDPEVLLINKDGNFIPSCGLFGGTKDEPLKVDKAIHIQEDNVSVEYNTAPCTNPATWNTIHHRALEIISTKAAKHGLQISTKTSASFKPENLDDSRAWLFGCDPDFNVWSLSINPKPTSKDPNLRCAGGHIHIGIPGLTKRKKILLGRLLDIVLGVPLSKFDTDLQRKELYGKAGAIRFKPYGIEYRTPSSFWLHNDRYMHFVWNASWKAAELILSTPQNNISAVMDNLEVPVQKAINHNDPASRMKVIKECNSKLIPAFQSEEFWNA